MPLVEQPEHERAISAARAALEAELFRMAWDGGRALGWEQAAALVLDESADPEDS